MKPTLIFLASLFFANAGVAAPGDTIWTRTYGVAFQTNVGYSLLPIDNNEFMISGWSSPNGQEDFYLMKIDSNGDTIWTNTYPRDSGEYAFSTEQTSDGGYIMSGYVCPTYPGRIDFYVIKTDSSGAMQWNRLYGGLEADQGCYIHQALDGGYIIGGWTQSLGAGGADLYLFKTNSSGNVTWTRTYGGSSDDLASAVHPLPDGGFIIAGQTASFGAGYDDAYLVKVDSAGNMIWSKTYGDNQTQQAYAVDLTNDGGYILVGTSGNPYDPTSFDFYIVKTDSLGDTLWTSTYGVGDKDEAFSVQQTSDGGYIIAGTTDPCGGDACLIRLDSLGQLLWISRYGGNDADCAYSVLQTSDGNFLFVGSSASYVEGLATQVYLAKVEGEGVTSARDNDRIPSGFILEGNYPNPFNAQTMIEYSLTKASPVVLEIFDLLGRKTATLSDGVQETGHHHLNWNAEGQPSGIYFYKIKTNNYSETKKMLLLR